MTIERIICGDNLIILKTIKDETVDLVYIDPPFFTNKNYEIIWNDGEELRQFGDRWITENKNGSGRASKDINVYIEWMEPRIKEIYRVLKKTGVFYLHCDVNANSYLRVMCDKIFGYNNLINEIIWCYTGIGASKKCFPRKHDTIYSYNKGGDYTFNHIFIPYKKSNKCSGVYKAREMTEEQLKGVDELDKRGKKVEDWWVNISIVNSQAKERLDYPTQKPETLLERIIKASSNERDLVMDCFAGCGTTLAVAKKLKRQFIGIDVSPTSCRLVAKRIGMSVSEIEGLPATPEEISTMKPFEFQNWVNREIGSKTGGKGADYGIDGWLEETPVQVKQYQAGRPDLDKFIAAIQRAGKTKAIFMAISFADTFKKEVARLKSEQGIFILPVTVDDIVKKEAKKMIVKAGLAPKNYLMYV